MDCYYSKMHTFRHFLFLNHRKSFGGSHFFRTLKFLHTSKASNRDIYSLTYALQILSHNTNNIRGTDFRRACIHTNGRRPMPDMNNSRFSSTSGSNSTGSGYGNGDGLHSFTKKKSGKSKTFWVCIDCGDSFGQWWGYCPACKKTDTLKQFTEESAPLGGGAGTRAAELSLGGCSPDTEFRDQHTAHKGWVANGTDDSEPQRLSDVTKGHNEEQWRIPLTGPFGTEVSRVLGGGLIPGSLILISGDPGVGKSTLLLQISATLSDGCEVNGPAPVLYVSGEESVKQIGSRACRMQIDSEEVRLYSSTSVEDIFSKINELSPRAVVVDSIQTVFLRGLTGTSGHVTQVKECASSFLTYAKKTQIPIFLVGHVTKSGDIAGPRVLEHIVDVVLYLEGDRFLSHRILRAVKNRFGSTDEIGVLEMGQYGLESIKNPSEIYISERNIDQDVLAGLALTVIIDGSRPFLIETQALCYIGTSSEATITRRFNGVEDKRANLIIAVLGKQVGLDFHGISIFLNVVGGVRVEETAADLAVAVSICSSLLEIPIPLKMAFIGEIGLGGELRTVARMDKRLNELAKLGFTRCVVPTSSMKSISGLEWEDFSLIQCKNVKEVVKKVFKVKVKPASKFSNFTRVELEGGGQQKGVCEDWGEDAQKFVSATVGEQNSGDQERHLFPESGYSGGSGGDVGEQNGVEGEAQQEGVGEDWIEDEQKYVSVSAGEQYGVSSVSAGEQNSGDQETHLLPESGYSGGSGGDVGEQNGVEGEAQQEGVGEHWIEDEQKYVSVSAGEQNSGNQETHLFPESGYSGGSGGDVGEQNGVEGEAQQEGVSEDWIEDEQKYVSVSAGEQNGAISVDKGEQQGGCQSGISGVGEQNFLRQSWSIVWSGYVDQSKFRGGSDGLVGEQNSDGVGEQNFLCQSWSIVWSGYVDQSKVRGGSDGLVGEQNRGGQETHLFPSPYPESPQFDDCCNDEQIGNASQSIL